ncbi:MAG: hypothetical protein WBP59_05070 [Ilumatobacteraceae bacterium]
MLIFLAISLAACSGGSSNGSDTTASASPSPTPAPNASVEPIAVHDGAAAFDQAVEDFGATSPEATVAGFAAFTGPLPSAPDVGRSAELYPSFSNLFEQYPLVADEIDTADRDAIDERLDELFRADFVIELDGPVEPEGFRSASPPTTLRELDDDDVDDTDRDAWTRELTSVWSQLNARLPAPDSLDAVILVSTPSFWTLDGAGEGPEPGAGTVRRSFVDSWPGFEPLRDRYGDHDCYIVVARDRDAAPSSGIGAAVIAHELFHCWHATRFSDDQDRFHGAGPWVYEGLAAWVGETIAGGTSYPIRRWLPSYAANDFSLFADSTAYEAYGYWSRVDEFVDLWGLIPSLVDTSSGGSSGAVFEEAIAATSGDGVLIATGALQQAELGPAWVNGGWMPSSIARRPGTHRATIDSDVVEVGVAAGQQAAHRVSVDAPDGSFVDVLITGYSSAAWGDGETLTAGPDPLDMRYCVGECACPGEPSPVTDGELPVGSSELTIALSGTGSGTATALVHVVDVGDCDEPDGSDGSDGSDDDATGGLLGTWRADPEAIAQAFTQASGYGPEVEPLEIAGVTGDVLMTFSDGGTGTLVYDNVRLFFVDAPIAELTLSGEGAFQWDSTAGAITITGTTYAISVTSSALGGDPLTLTSDDVPAAGTTRLAVSLGGDDLSVAAEGSIDRVFFPTLWRRI